MNALAIALDLGAAGLPVFPCNRLKRPSIPRSEGGHGFHDATIEPAEIRRLFNRPNAVLVAVPTGERSNFDVLDIDPRHGGDRWEAANTHRLPETRVHQTPSGGRHWLFVHEHGVANSAGKIGPGVDVRGTGGYVAMPPSGDYRVVSGAPIAHWPDWLLALALPPPRPQPPLPSSPSAPISSALFDQIIGAALDRVRAAPDGQKHLVLRNQALLIGGLQDKIGLADAEAMRLLMNALPSSVQDWRNAEQTAGWGLTQGRARPIDIRERSRTRLPDPRRKATAARALQLMRTGAPSGTILARLQAENADRADPLPQHVVDETALWAAQRLRGGNAT